MATCLNLVSKMYKKRHFARVPFGIKLIIAIDRKKFDATIIDISLKGALVTRPKGWEEQDNLHELMLEIKLAGPDTVMRINAEVAHEGKETLGLRFVGIDLESISHLRRLLELNAGDPLLIEREVAALRYSVKKGIHLQ